MEADLEIVFELSLKQVLLAIVALYEDVFGLNNALVGRNGLDALTFLAKPSHVLFAQFELVEGFQPYHRRREG